MDEGRDALRDYAIEGERACVLERHCEPERDSGGERLRGSKSPESEVTSSQASWVSQYSVIWGFLKS